ncbi:glycosyltransferase [Sulfitobacter sp. EE-36]|uniref:glycosyltransferase n=1 Tax=Sulfitobacter TaxID=60136 RepID=UPI00032355D9|nr:glycosyltransferase [Sulfitobacter sp. EE-36]
MNNTVAVAISSYRSDVEVIALLNSIFADRHPSIVSVLVVDSLASGKIADAIKVNGWSVQYENSEVNLGSAGNLERRMQLASETGAAWCYCLNHDANWDNNRLTEMLKTGSSQSKVGAVYPILHHGSMERPWEDGRRTFTPTAGNRFARAPVGDSNSRVVWSSSNGALYSTAVRKQGIVVMSELWMGYEDLAYGMALEKGGWLQLMCRNATLGSIFDYVPRRFLFWTLQAPNKPVWQVYYGIRNLILIRKKYGNEKLPLSIIIKKLAQSSLRIIILDDKKSARIHMLYAGALAGFLSMSGKGPKP